MTWIYLLFGSRGWLTKNLNPVFLSPHCSNFRDLEILVGFTPLSQRFIQVVEEPPLSRKSFLPEFFFFQGCSGAGLRDWMLLRNTGINNRYRWEHCSKNESQSSLEALTCLQDLAGHVNELNREGCPEEECRTEPGLKVAARILLQAIVAWQKKKKKPCKFPDPLSFQKWESHFVGHLLMSFKTLSQMKLGYRLMLVCVMPVSGHKHWCSLCTSTSEVFTNALSKLKPFEI